MGLPKLKPKISAQDYLEGEKISQIKHEYLDGEVYEMAGTSIRHNRIIRNLLSRLNEKLDGSDCETFFVDIKVYVKKLNRYYYPDLLVVCGEINQNEHFTNSPLIIIEILTPKDFLRLLRLIFDVPFF